MKTINVLSWGGGTQSTALMLKMLKGEVLDQDKNPIMLDYIVFADTKNESKMVYEQVFKVQKYVKDKYGHNIIVTSKNKELKSDKEIIEMIKNGLKYRNSEYADLFQSHVLYFQGHIKSIDVMPFWTRDKKTGEIGKTPFKACTMSFKIAQIMKELRIREGVRSFSPKKYKINMYIGYSIDEIGRMKPNPLNYVENFSPLIEMQATRQDCVNYVIKELGFKPRSSVCNMCYANDFNKVYDIYENDKQGWEKLIILDDAMEGKSPDHGLDSKVFMFRWQAELDIRLRNVDMEKTKEKLKKKYTRFSIFDMEQEMACMGGCFL